ncbi:serine/threonine-protein kinase, partial [Corallococcus exiguus]
PVAVFIAMEMCRGLHYAHSRTDSSGKPLGIVHRDISPDNVLVSYEGQVKIVDFGIAKAQLLRGFKTAPGVVKGKYLFFSPEQARGEDVDARTDVWATGVVLYELLCGRLPVDGPPHVVMMKIAHGEIPPLSQLRPDLPEALNRIVLQALSPDPAQRFATSHAFGDALAGFLYANHPRFSSLSLAHLLRVLFRGDLLNEGRELAVPDDFLEELKAWRNPVTPDQVPTVPHLRAIKTPR